MIELRKMVLTNIKQDIKEFFQGAFYMTFGLFKMEVFVLSIALSFHYLFKLLGFD